MDEKNILTTKLRPRDILSQNAMEREKRLVAYEALGSASSWREGYLDWLLVDFDDKRRDDLERFLLDKIQHTGLMWTQAHQESTELLKYK